MSSGPSIDKTFKQVIQMWDVMCIAAPWTLLNLGSLASACICI